MVMDSKPGPELVGQEFVRQYYTMLNEGPQYLFRFYSKDSCFIHGGGERHGQEQQPVVGQENIHQKIMSLGYKDCRAKIRLVDAQSTIGDAVVVQVTGELSNNEGPMRRFMQTFVLAPQSVKNYYVHNDIFRYQDELFDEDESCVNEETPAESRLPDERIINTEPRNPVENYHLDQMPVEPEAAPLTNGHHEQTVEPPAPEPLPERDPTPEPEPEPQQPEPELELEPEPEPVIVPEPKPVVKVKAKEPEGPAAAAAPTAPRSWANLVNPTPSPATPPQETIVGPNEASVDTTPPKQDRPPKEQRPRVKKERSRDRAGLGVGDTEKSDKPRGGFGSGGSDENRDRTRSERPERNRFPDAQQVFVGNLPQHTSEFELKACFSEYGKVLEVRINRANVRSPFGFVVFEQEESVQKLLSIGRRSIPFTTNEGDHRNINIEEKRAPSLGAKNTNRPPRRSDGQRPPRQGFGQRENSGNRDRGNRGPMRNDRHE